MKILWLTWKDRQHPDAGGAEVVNEELAKRLVANGHQVHFICGNFKCGKKLEERDGFVINRSGNKYTAFIFAFILYWKKYSTWPDLVIDETNTVPYFVKFYQSKKNGQKNILFIHQLAREIWFHQILFPMSVIGYIAEPIYLWMLRNSKVITISNSTKQDLMRFGFKEKNIDIISEGIELKPAENISNIQKFEIPTVLSLGSIRPMKRTLEVVKGFEFLKNKIPNAQLLIAGDTSGKYADQVLKYVDNSKYKESIILKGRVTKEEKIEIMQRSHVLAVTSLKEGWGLVVTEAGSQGTPAVVYDVDGLRDSVIDKKTGLVCSENTPENLAEKISELLQDMKRYEEIRTSAYEFSKTITFEKSFKDLSTILDVYRTNK